MASNYGLELFFMWFSLKGLLDILNLALVTTVKTCLRSCTQNKMLPHSRDVQISVQKMLAVLSMRGLVWAWSIIDVLSTEGFAPLTIIDYWCLVWLFQFCIFVSHSSFHSILFRMPLAQTLNDWSFTCISKHRLYFIPGNTVHIIGHLL